MSEIQRSTFRWILLAATILTVLATSSLSVDMKTLRKKAEAGDAKAQFNIGSMYENGSGIHQDYAGRKVVPGLRGSAGAWPSSRPSAT